MHSVEQLLLLQQYIVLFTIIAGLPGIGLYIKKDKRWGTAILIYISTILIMIYFYIKNNKIFFPDLTLTQIKNK